MEKRDLYDINRKPTGKTIFKGDPIPEGNYILVNLVYIQNNEGKFLIQKRSVAKNGKFATTGGHPKEGETSLEGIMTEIKEEIGLDVNPKELKLYFSDRFDSEQVFADAYYLKMDVPNIEDLILQKEEVDSVHWFTADDIRSLMKEGKYFKNHYEEFEILLKWLKK